MKIFGVFIGGVLFLEIAFADDKVVAEQKVCNIEVLYGNCMMAFDDRVPKRLKRYGEASCYVGLEKAKSYKDKKAVKLFKKAIKENNIVKENFRDDIKVMKTCMEQDDVRSCKTGLVLASERQKVDVCKR